MSEEEKKAIETMNTIIKFGGDNFLCKEHKKQLQTILNIIEKQQKEIEEWQKAYIKENNYWLKFRNKINKIANNDKDCSDNEVIKAVQELKKYDYRNIKISEDNKLSSIHFTKEQLDLMNLGIALYIGIPKMFEESEENDI